MRLLNLERFSGELTMDKQDSSLDEWQKEARKLELQGKQEQADDIRSRILKQKPVPWPVLDRNAFETLKEEALTRNNKKKKLLALEYARIYFHLPLLNELERTGFNAAVQPEEKALKTLHQKHYMTYDLKNPGSVLRETEKYGIDHRTIFNLTPLMVAARLGNSPLIDALIERGANPEFTGSNGLNALQIALERACVDQRYARTRLTAIYQQLEPDSLAIQVQGQLIKLDKRLMGLFILNLMMALFYRKLGEAAGMNEGYTAKALTEWVSTLPDAVLPEKRKRQSYISGILSSNEVDREAPYNRRLFKRIRRGHYIINPNLKLRQGDQWVDIHDLLKLEDLGFKPPWKRMDPKTSRHFMDKNSIDFLDRNKQQCFNTWSQHIQALREEGKTEEKAREEARSTRTVTSTLGVSPESSALNEPA
ncbi:MAG: hypothetical protein ACPG5T_01445 [Endozoicomonas sp.]